MNNFGTSSRRRFMHLAAGTGAVLGFGGAVGQQIQAGTIELGGERDGWVGQSPDAIADQTNPTLQLQPGETYTVTWENVDGRSHNFVVETQGGEHLVESEILETQGETQTVEFEATAEMSEYYCSVHPESMRGSIEVGGEGEMQAADGDTLTVSRVFSADRLTGEAQVETVQTAGEGAAVFGLSEDETEFHYALLVTNLSDVTMAHIHLGAEGENGEVVAWLFGARDESGEFTRPVEGGVVADGILAQGVITEESLVGPLADASLSDLLSELEGETAYVNVHTTANPGGEIRGQIREAQATNVMLTQETNVTAAPGQGFSVETRGTVAVGRGTTGGGGDGQTVEQSGPIMITYEGTVAPGNTVTLTVTAGGEPLPEADVYVRDGDNERQLVGQTDQNGQIDVTVPAEGDRAGELRVQVRRGELEGELEVENGNGDRGGGRDDDDDSSGRGRGGDDNSR